MAVDKKTCNRKCIIPFIIMLVLLLSGLVVFLILEVYVPVPFTLNKMSTPTALPSLITSVNPSEQVYVNSIRLSSHAWQHRQGFEQNSHVQMLQKVQSKLNLSDCWLCARLPQAVGNSVMTYAEPLPLNTSAYAVFWMLFSHTSLDVGVNPLPFIFDHIMLSVRGVPVWYASGNEKTADLLVNKRDTLPFHELITVGKFNKAAHRPPTVEECKGTCPIPIMTHVIREPSMCISRRGSMFVGTSTGCSAEITIPIDKFGQTTYIGSSNYFIGRSVYFLCGIKAYLWLPVDWGGSCSLVLLLPDILPVQTKHLYKLRQMTRLRRHVHWSDVVKGLFPWYGVVSNVQTIRQLSLTLEEAVNSTSTALEAVNLEMRAIRLVALQNRMGLDLLFVKEGGLCEKIGISCCTYIPEMSSTILKSIDKLHEIRKNLSSLSIVSDDWSVSSWFSQTWFDWGWKLLAGICGFLILLVFICIGISFLPSLIHCCSPRQSSRMMVTDHVGTLIRVAGYGLLPQIRYTTPNLEIRHLYTSSPRNKSQIVTTIGSEPGLRLYTLKPSIYETVSSAMPD